jgi:hypothetical protein
MEKPYKTYYGGKEADGTYQKIISEMPPHDVYCERNALIENLKKEGIL